MADPTKSYLYGVRQIRLVNLTPTGATDPSATSYDITNPQSVGYSFIYIDGEEQVQRGGDDICAMINEDDKFVGVNFDVVLAALMPEVDETICGGVATPGASAKWTSPISDAEEAYPFSMIIWVANYTESDRGSVQDGFIMFTLPFCKGKRSTDTNADKVFGKPAYSIEARNNESDIETPTVLPAISYEKVETIVPLE